MQIGVVFPQTEIGADAGAVRAFAAAANALGYRHLLAYDHVLGADRSVYPEWSGPYDLEDSFHEPFVLFSWLASQTTLEFATAILVGPQRQTALVAKQAAELDILSGGGRLRLGLGIGWNQVEYQALGQSFADRAARLDEQVTLLRRLWNEPSVTYTGAHHTIRGAGIAPLPITRPIPIWLGAMAPAALRRVGRVADGWFPQVRPGAGLEEALEVIAAAAAGAGRDPANIGMEGQVAWTPGDPDRLARHADRWRRAGASHLALNTMGAVRLPPAGPDGASATSVVEGHIAILTAAADVLVGE
ncbi:MAG: TIGR03619 family F420-dependent LLM class oxidoreductase [Acidimicrobiales bacterium]